MLPDSYPNLALAPGGLAADASVTGGLKPRQKLRQRASVIGMAGKTSNGMALPGARTAARCLIEADIRCGHEDFISALAHCFEIEIQGRAVAVKRMQRGDAVAHAGEENWKQRLGRDLFS